MKYWNTNCDPDWARDNNYLWFNTRIGSSLYVAYGYDTYDRLACYLDHDDSKCNQFKITDNMKNLKKKYCGKDISSDDIDCLKRNFNLDVSELCDDSEYGITTMYGAKGANEIKHLDSICLNDKASGKATDKAPSKESLKKQSARTPTKTNKSSRDKKYKPLNLSPIEFIIFISNLINANISESDKKEKLKEYVSKLK